MTIQLHRFPVFKGLTRAQVKELTSAGKTLKYPAGTEIITLGDSGKEFFFLLEGELRVFLPDGAGNHELARFTPPAIFGEMELLTGQPRVASVSAITDVEVVAIPFTALRSRMRKRDPAALNLVLNMAKVLALRLAATVEKLSDIETGKVSAQPEELREFKRKLFSDWSF